jgi:hypothetical protein
MRHLRTTTAATVAAAALLASSSASARLPVEEQTSTTAYPAVAAPAATVSPDALTAPAPPITQTVDDEGFDWGAAAIGAGGVGVVLLLTAGGASAIGHRRHGVA